MDATKESTVSVDVPDGPFSNGLATLLEQGTAPLPLDSRARELLEKVLDTLEVKTMTGSRLTTVCSLCNDQYVPAMGRSGGECVCNEIRSYLAQHPSDTLPAPSAE